MPEGDTIHAVARALRPILVCAPLRALELEGRSLALRPDEAASAIDAVGKHLLMRLASPVAPAPRVLRVHLGMKGSWHRYRPGERWQRAPSSARAVLTTDQWVVVCFRAPQVELYPDPRAVTQGVVGKLGPDLLGETLDIAEVLRRARLPEQARTAAADLLLDQTVACGIGNVYKSEVLYLAGVHPWHPVGSIEDATLIAIYDSARELMRDNLERGGFRVTTRSRFRDPLQPIPRGLRHWVYRRAGRPCLRCQTAVRSRRQGPTARMTYWCPRCQPPAASGEEHHTV